MTWARVATPRAWGCASDHLARAVALEDVFAATAVHPENLIKGFPAGWLQPYGRAAITDKSYRLRTAPLTGELADLNLNQDWTRALDYLRSPQYLSDACGVLQLDPSLVTNVELRATEYRKGDFMSRHTDRPDKYFSHLLYLSEGWDPAWGGRLSFYPRQDAPAACCEIDPLPGSSVLFARTDTSWHEVGEVDSHAVHVRRTLLVHAYRAISAT